MTIYGISKYPADASDSAVLHFVDIEDRVIGDYDVLYKIGDDGWWMSMRFCDDVKRRVDIPKGGATVYFKVYHRSGYTAFGFGFPYSILQYWYNPPYSTGYNGGYDYCSYTVPANNTGDWLEICGGYSINSNYSYRESGSLYLEQRP